MEATQATEAPRCRRRGGLVVFVLATLVAGFLGGFIGSAWGQHAHHGPFGRALADPAKMDQRVDRVINRFARRVDATPEQKAKLSAIGRSAARDIVPLHTKLHAARTEAMGILAAPTIDRAAIERLRADQMQTAEAVSRRVSQALGEAAEVLTPEQRKKIAERMQRRS
jgi:protein CpxP